MRFFAFILIAAFAIPTLAKPHRSTTARHEFVRLNACPATERHRLPCPGFHIDHVRPLCAGGADTTDNMQWLTVADHKAKTRIDVKACRNERNP